MNNSPGDFVDLLLTGELSEQTKEAQRQAVYKGRVWGAYLRVAEGLAASGRYHQEDRYERPYMRFQAFCSDGLGLATEMVRHFDELFEEEREDPEPKRSEMTQQEYLLRKHPPKESPGDKPAE